MHANLLLPYQIRFLQLSLAPPEELIGIMKIKAFVLFTILDNACWTAARLLLACVKVRGIKKLKPIFKIFAECVD